MNTSGKKIRLATWVYWVLLLYIIAALVWWFVSLEKQNHRMSEMKTERLRSTVDSVNNAALFTAELKKITSKEKRDTAKHLAEGLTFLVLILIGAAFVYRSVKHQLKLQQQQQNFMMAVTHELKTPIAVTKLNLETLQKHQLDETKRQKILQMTLEDASLPAAERKKLQKREKALIEQHQTEWAGDWVGIREFRKHTGWYLKGYPVGSEVRRQLNQRQSRDELVETANDLFDVVKKGVVKIPVNHTYALKDAAQAHRDLEARKTTGTTVLIP